MADLYDVDTRRLKEAVRRNIDRLPQDFIFELSPNEFDSLRSQIATLKTGRGHKVHAFCIDRTRCRYAFFCIKK